MKRKIHGLLSMLACIAILLFSADAFSVHYTAKPIEARVVDAETGKSLEGTIVVLNWELVDSGNFPVGQLVVAETVTGNNGKFSFPAWGPKPVPPNSIMGQQAPQLLLFKEGFQYRRLANPATTGASRSSALDADWSGKTIEMWRLPEDVIVKLGPDRVVSKRSLSFNGLGFSLGWAYRGRDCEWKQVPRMLVAIHRTKLEFDRQGLRTDLKSIDDLPRSDKCGSPRDYLREYLP
jgi:hypothetical protein